jgi:hypothetical protein
MQTVGKVIAIAALLTVSTTAFAAVRGFHARASNFSSGVVAGVDVPLNAAGATIVTFNLPGAGKKVLTFSGECAVDAPAGNNFAWLDIDIIVNGVIVPVTNQTSDAFCSADGVAGISGYVRPSITVLVNGLQGNNTVRIRAKGQAGATQIWLSDTALMIHD